VAKCLTLPGESEIADLMDVADPDAIHTVRRFVITQIAAHIREELLRTVCSYLLGPISKNWFRLTTVT
jgi:aminopeptidase N